MTKLRKLEITLNDSQVVYFPGQVVHGQVIVELTDDMKMKGINVLCKGKAHVNFGEGEYSFKESEKYFSKTLLLYPQPGSSGDDVTLQAGNHKFPFQFVLPVNLPGSFEGHKCSYVRYWLKTTIGRPWKFDLEYKMVFTIGSVLDLNTQPNALAPTQITESKTVCCCCCKSQPITATLRIDRTGYVPGESICCNAEIQDGSGRGINSSKIKLMLKPTYRSHKGTEETQSIEVNCLRHGSITLGDSDIWRRAMLKVPPVPPSNLINCSLIELNYFVELAVDVVDTPFDLILELPIIIGTIPLQSVVNQYMPQIQPGTITNQPMGFSAPVNFDLPPFSFQECILGKVDTTDDDDKNAAGNMSYAPSYTYYDWESHQSPSAPAV